MGKPNYPHAATIAGALRRERRGINWSLESIEIACQNLTVAAKDLPDTSEYSEVRRAYYRALDRIRGARKALTDAYDASAEAMLVAERSAAVPITNRRLLERYDSSHGQHGADMVSNARKERKRREDDHAAWERRRREEECQRFLKNRKGEGMREDQD
jgi:hypothetical protein